jgi:hypothetical protein
MEHVRSVLPAVLRKRGVLEHAIASLVLVRAASLLKRDFPKLEGRLRVKSFDEQGVLTIVAKDSVALALLRLRTESLTHTLERSFEGQLSLRIVAKRG